MTGIPAKNVVSRHAGFVRIQESTPSRNSQAVFTPEKIGIPYRFNVAYQNWRDDTFCSSLIEEMTGNPFFAEIVAMGPPVLPFLFRKMREEPSFIFLAAQEIVGANPFEGQAFPNMTAVVNAWLEWANLGNLTPEEVH